MPQCKLTLVTAMDALTHTVEFYLSKEAFSFSEILFLKAVTLIAEDFIMCAYNTFTGLADAGGFIL